MKKSTSIIIGTAGGFAAGVAIGLTGYTIFELSNGKKDFVSPMVLMPPIIAGLGSMHFLEKYTDSFIESAMLHGNASMFSCFAGEYVGNCLRKKYLL
jgi:hypothetical protein